MTTPTTPRTTAPSTTTSAPATDAPGAAPADLATKLRWALLGIAGVTIVGTALELASIRHWTEKSQLLAWACLVGLTIALVAIARGAHGRLVPLIRLGLLGVCASFGMILFGTAYKLAESSFVAPFEYSSMIWAVLFGFILFGDIPGLHTLAGGVIVVSAGLFMLWMDRYRDRSQPQNA